ncbi:MAG: RNA-binding protein [Ruminococcus sp.]|nr:RNA-binding protein [Ruminococcus sp.]
MNDPTDKLFAARLRDMVSLCERDGAPVFSSFFDERQCAEAEAWCARNTGSLRYRLWGGYDDARRRMLAVYPDYCEDYILEDFPFVCLTFAYREEDRLSHRDFLGSFMGLQLKRDVIGDIVVTEGTAQAFVTEVAAKLISGSISKIGRVGVKISGDKPFILENAQKFQEISGTVASLRLDCVVGLAAKISREKAAALIRADRAEVNHLPVSSVSHELRGGDVLSIRGYGRFVLSEINGHTKKDRIHIILKKYI